jgi:hypothetical protein
MCAAAHLRQPPIMKATATVRRHRVETEIPADQLVVAKSC